MNRIIVTGCLGRIGRPLMDNLVSLGKNVVGCDIGREGKQKESLSPFLFPFQFHKFDILDDFAKLKDLVDTFKPDTIIHLASMSNRQSQEKMATFSPCSSSLISPSSTVPSLPFAHFNNHSWENLLELSRLKNIKIFMPSSIAAFGPGFGKRRRVGNDKVVMRPQSLNGICKLYCELLGEYYHYNYGVDFRSIRLPQIISNNEAEEHDDSFNLDYASRMINYALKNWKRENKEKMNNIHEQPFHCPINKNTRLPMIHIQDAIQAIVKLLNIDRNKMKKRNLIYNVQGLSFTPLMLKRELEIRLKCQFNVKWKVSKTINRDKGGNENYKKKQLITENYPQSLNDDLAKRDWKWKPKFNNLQKLVSDFVNN